MRRRPARIGGIQVGDIERAKVHPPEASRPRGGPMASGGNKETRQGLGRNEAGIGEERGRDWGGKVTNGMAGGNKETRQGLGRAMPGGKKRGREWDRTIDIDVKGRGLAVVIVKRIRGIYNRVDPHVTPKPIPEVGRNVLNGNALRPRKKPMGWGGGTISSLRAQRRVQWV
jgi:hypothetical protein